MTRIMDIARRTRVGVSHAMSWATPVCWEAKAKGRRTAGRTISGVSAATIYAHEFVQGMLASDLGAQVNATVQALVAGPATAIDKAMDAKFLLTGEGGGLHRLMDGGHTVLGSIKAAASVGGDDSIFVRTAGWATAYAKDLSTPAGMPVVTMSRDTYHALADRAEALGISRSTFADLVTFDAAEAFGAMVGSIALALRWSDAQAHVFAKIAASSGMAAAMSANPLLAGVSLVALAKAHVEAEEGDWRKCTRSAAEGAAMTGTSMAMGTAVATAGGPAMVAVVASIAATIAVQRLMTAHTARRDGADRRTVKMAA